MEDPPALEHARGEPWLTGDTYNLSIGQGYLLATPLQMANVVAVVANGGTLYRPQIVYQVIDADGKVVRGFSKQELSKVPVSATSLEYLRTGMREAILRGTAVSANFKSLAVMGKTGTAEYGQLNEKGERPAMPGS